jgi:hypothetical protein
LFNISLSFSLSIFYGDTDNSNSSSIKSSKALLSSFFGEAFLFIFFGGESIILKSNSGFLELLRSFYGDVTALLYSTFLLSFTFFSSSGVINSKNFYSSKSFYSFSFLRSSIAFLST